ncbi:hypothetical protein CTAYLR_008402 [Chrysophaeum taylorii]|uniref:START domain-containing protein n=1 Tax=Chrysophaeum taylorii TaxID=2483200 RepID=A0AAD7XNV0_9STRA|nr:hypothetical protein CTAYLR_008402 [Chrysophaeum taylorii]
MALLLLLTVGSAETFSFRGIGEPWPTPGRWFSQTVRRHATTHLHKTPGGALAENVGDKQLESEKLVQRVLKLVDDRSGRWLPIVTRGRCKVWLLKEPDSPHACILAKGVIDASAPKVYDLFAKTERAGEFNEYCAQCVDIERLDYNTKVSWSVTKSFGNGLFKPRDFVTLCHFAKLRDGSKCVVNTATTHRAKPENPRFQRAEVILAANIVKPLGADKTHLTLLTSVNPRGALDNCVCARIMNQIIKRSPVAFFNSVERAAMKTRLVEA